MDTLMNLIVFSPVSRVGGVGVWLSSFQQLTSCPKNLSSSFHVSVHSIKAAVPFQSVYLASGAFQERLPMLQCTLQYIRRHIPSIDLRPNG